MFISLRGGDSSVATTYTASTNELQSTINRLNNFFQNQDNSVNPETINQNARSSLHHKKIIEAYAADNSLVVSDSEVDSYYQQRVDRLDSEADLLEEIDRLYGTSKQEYLQQIRYDLLREKVQAQLDTPLNEWLDEQRSSSILEIN